MKSGRGFGASNDISPPAFADLRVQARRETWRGELSETFRQCWSWLVNLWSAENKKWQTRIPECLHMFRCQLFSELQNWSRGSSCVCTRGLGNRIWRIRFLDWAHDRPVQGDFDGVVGQMKTSCRQTQRLGGNHLRSESLHRCCWETRLAGGIRAMLLGDEIVGWRCSCGQSCFASASWRFELN